MQKVYIEAGEFFGTEGEDKKAYDACELSMKYAKIPLDIARVENNLGVYAQRMGNVALSKHHFLIALAIRESEPNTDKEEVLFLTMLWPLLCGMLLNMIVQLFF